MKRLYLSVLAIVCAVAVTASCSFAPGSVNDGGDGPSYARFIVRGIVAADIDGYQFLVDGMMVVVDFGDGMRDTVYTSRGGVYNSMYDMYYGYDEPRKIAVTVYDVDGKEDGEFDPVTKYVNSTGTGFLGGNPYDNYVGEKSFFLDFLLTGKPGWGNGLSEIQ